MDFEDVCMKCLKNQELINEFCRLKGISNPEMLTPIEMAIDRVCGYDSKTKFVKDFTAFVFQYIWSPNTVGQ